MVRRGKWWKGEGAGRERREERGRGGGRRGEESGGDGGSWEECHVEGGARGNWSIVVRGYSCVTLVPLVGGNPLPLPPPEVTLCC